MAPPILPAPTSSRGCAPAIIVDQASPCVSNSTAASASSGRLAGPDDELKGLIIALAGFDRRGEHRFELRGAGLDPFGQKQGVPIHDDALGLPEVEVADPELLVDERQELHHLGLAPLLDLEVEGAGKMQRLERSHPGHGKIVVAERAGDRDGDLVVARAIERPIVRGGDLLDQVDGVGGGG